jgi:predicted amino acid dehydrogenase/uncharacterized membrane protein
MDNIILNRPERRRFTRINCSLPIKFIAKSGIGEADSDLREYNGWGRNISEGGIYIETPNLERRFLAYLNQSRCKIELKIYLFGQDNHVLTQGEIIWTEEENLGFSVQFAQINEYAKDRIKSYISKRLSARPGLEDLEETRQSIRDITFPIKIESSIIVKQPKEAVYNLLKNMECFPEFMENVKQVTLLEGRRDRTITEWEIDLDSTAIIWKQENIFDDRQMSIRFKMLEGDFGRYEGEWNLFGLLTGTEIRLSIVMDWGAPALARYIEDVLKKKTQDILDGMLNGVKRKLWIENAPQLLKFAFVIHPYDLDVISVAFNEPGCNNERRYLLEKMFEWFPTFACSHVVGTRSLTGKEIDGELIYCPLLPNQVLNLGSDFVLERVIGAAKIAESQGAKILGLGAYIAGVGRRGTLVANNIDIPVTTGTCYTIAITVEAILEAAKEVGVRLINADVVIIGATGAVGSVCSQILADSVVNLTLVARNKEKLEQLANTIHNNSAARVKIAFQINRAMLKNADIVVMATNTPGTLFDIQLLKPGAIIYDISVPKNVSKEAADLRQDILVIDGGVVKPPGEVEFNFYFGLPPGLCYACIAETMILALEERFECYSLGGNISLAKVKEIAQLGAKHGFKLAELRSFGKELSKGQIEEVRDSYLKKKY